MAPSGKSPREVLTVPQDAPWAEIVAAHKRALELLDNQSLIAYGMFDGTAERQLRADLDEAFLALSAERAAPSESIEARARHEAAEAITQDNSPGLAAAPQHQNPAELSRHPLRPEAPTHEAVVDEPMGAFAPTEPTAAALPSPIPALAAEPPAHPATAVAAPPPSLGPPPAASGVGALRLRLCAPRTEPLTEPLTGAVLRQLREGCGAAVDDVCEVTKINRRYIVALEEEDFSLLPAAVYVRGFVGEYARVLGLQSQASAPYVEAYSKWVSARS